MQGPRYDIPVRAVQLFVKEMLRLIMNPPLWMFLWVSMSDHTAAIARNLPQLDRALR